MPKTSEQKMVLNAPAGGKITHGNIADDGKSIEITVLFKVDELDVENFDELFPIIDPTKIIGHKLLEEHIPQTANQTSLMVDIRRGLELQLKPFRVPCVDPSFEHDRIVFKRGQLAEVGRSAYWWRDACKRFMPSKNSRIMTDLHWAAVLGDLMMYLVDEENYTTDDAWLAVCDDSRVLGHYCNSDNAKTSFEPTGFRRVGKFYDLANTRKIVASYKSNNTFYTVGGYFGNFSFDNPLSKVVKMFYLTEPFSDGVARPVMDV